MRSDYIYTYDQSIIHFVKDYTRRQSFEEITKSLLAFDFNFNFQI